MCSKEINLLILGEQQMDSTIYGWNDIQSKFSNRFDTLILGNGASIALNSDYTYTSLYKKACDKNYLDESLKNLFNTLNAHDFEIVLKHLSTTVKVLQVLQKKDEAQEISKIYIQVTEALKNVVMDVCAQDEELVKKNYKKMIPFLENFKTVISTNYDSILYRTILLGNSDYQGKNRFKDCFTNDSGVFPYKKWAYLKTPHSSLDKSTLFFYLHGNIVLYSNIWKDIEYKIITSEDGRLLKSIIEQWDDPSCVPIMITGGNSTEKLKAIRQSQYLSEVYDDVLTDLDSTVVLYGLSISENDEHIFDRMLKKRLKEKRIEKIAISTVNEQERQQLEKNINRIQFFKGYEDKICFFDANSCWVNGPEIAKEGECL